MVGRYFRAGILVTLIALLGAASSFAQVSYDTATLKGTIYDPKGGAVPGAAVTVTIARAVELPALFAAVRV